LTRLKNDREMARKKQKYQRKQKMYKHGEKKQQL
jgi:hypothetical protein